MKLTEHKRKWSEEKINHYCSLLKCSVPKVFLTMAEYNSWKKQKRAESGYKRVGRTEALGVCHRQDGFLVILIKRSPSLDKLDDTIRHELIHWAKPSYNHRSQRFFDCMRKLKIGRLNDVGRFV